MKKVLEKGSTEKKFGIVSGISTVMLKEKNQIGQTVIACLMVSRFNKRSQNENNRSPTSFYFVHDRHKYA